jgi:hypothetical protein
MSQDINLQEILPKAKKLAGRGLEHISFIFVLAVLLTYVFVVWRISALATVEPSTEQESAALAGADIAKVNKEAVRQIESLEQSNAEVHSLFEQARNNPFDE